MLPPIPANQGRSRRRARSRDGRIAATPANNKAKVINSRQNAICHGVHALPAKMKLTNKPEVDQQPAANITKRNARFRVMGEV